MGGAEWRVPGVLVPGRKERRLADALEVLEIMKHEGTVRAIGLGPIVALYDRSSASYQIREHIRHFFL